LKINRKLATISLRMEKTEERIETIEDASEEQLYLVSALTEDSAKALSILEGHIKSSGAKVVKAEDLGPKPLAFPINKKRQLNLVSVFFTLERKDVAALTEEFRHESGINRFIITTWREDPEKKMSSRSRKPRDV